MNLMLHASRGYPASKPWLKVIIAASILASSVVACGVAEPETAGYRYSMPRETGDGWQTATLQAVDMDEAPIVDLMDNLIDAPTHELHGIVVIKDQRLVFEEYFSGRDLDLSDLGGQGVAYSTRTFGPETLHSVASVSKTVTSALLGIALDQGLLPGTDVKMFELFPDYAELSDEAKEGISIEQMLTMTSGLPWDESLGYDDPRNDLTAMVFSPDPVGLVLGRTLETDPGTAFRYNSGTANLLGEIIRRASSLSLDEYAGSYLFGPLGINSYAWYAFPERPEMTVASSTLYLRPRDMAKVGQLYLNGGTWKGVRVVSEEWVTRSIQRNVEVPDSPSPRLSPGYGFLWWVGTFPAGNTRTYFAAGYGGEFIFVFPELEMVVVITAGAYEASSYDSILNVVNDYILDAAGR